MKPHRVTIDPSAKRAYVYLMPIGPGDVATTVELFGNADVLLDFSETGALMGIELADVDLLRPAWIAFARVTNNLADRLRERLGDRRG